MKCSAFEQELLAQDLGQELRPEARLHAAACKQCQLLFHSEHRLFHAFDKEKQMRVPPFLATRVMAGLQKREARVRSMPVWKRALQVAAVLLALVGGYFGSVMMDHGFAKDDFSVVLTGYFLIDEPGLSIEEGWLYSEFYEN